MNAKPYLHQKIFSNSKGFTLLELIVVLAGLGILSSLAIPNFISLLDSNKVDEIKALLNSAAADCLQKSRSITDPIIDKETISDGIIKDTGYKISTRSIFDSNGDPKCSTLWLEPIIGDANDSIRYNIGFSLSDGNLDKLASTEVAEKKADCIKWAGKCEFSKAAKILAEHKQKVKEAEESCSQQLRDWKENKKMNPFKFKMWDSSKGPDTCPKSPPEGAGDTYNPETNTCTTAGCDPGVPVWGLWDNDKGTGTVFYDEDLFKKKRRELIGEKCDKQIKDEYEATNYTNPSSDGVPLSECQGQKYWFVDGGITGPLPNGSEEKWKEAKCNKNIKGKENENWTDEQAPSPIEYCEKENGSPRQFYFCRGEDKKDIDIHAQCIREKKIAECETDVDKKRESGFNGKYTNPMQGPPPCGRTVWFCNGIQQDTENEYLETSCGKMPEEPSCKPYLGTPVYCDWGGGWRNHQNCKDFCWD